MEKLTFAEVQDLYEELTKQGSSLDECEPDEVLRELAVWFDELSSGGSS